MNCRELVDRYLIESKYYLSYTTLDEIAKDFVAAPKFAGKKLRDSLIELVANLKFRGAYPDLNYTETFYFFSVGLSQDIRRPIKTRGIFDSKSDLKDLVINVFKEYKRNPNSTRIGNQFRIFLDSYFVGERNGDIVRAERGVVSVSGFFNAFVKELHNQVPSSMRSDYSDDSDGSSNWVVSIEKPGVGESEYDIQPDVDEVYPLFKKFGIKKGDIFNQGHDDLSVELKGWTYDKVKELVSYLNKNLPAASDDYAMEYGMPSTSHNAVGMLYTDDDEFFEHPPIKEIY